MIFNNKFNFEEYLSKNDLEMVDDYPASYLKDHRNYRIAVLLGTQDLPQYHIKIDTDADFPIGVIFDEDNNQVNIISLREKQI